MKSALAIFKNNAIRLYTLCIISGFMLLLAAAVPSSAQTNDDQIWQSLINLSQSGTATNPSFVVDANGNAHVFGEDTFSGFVYTSGSGEDWTAPLSIQVPFTDPPFFRPNNPGFKGMLAPKLVSDNNERIHAFWTDSDNILWYSRVLIGDIGLGQSGWTVPQQLSATARAAASFINNDGTFHLAYINLANTADTLAGIYYRQSLDGGETWSEPQLLYASAYLRGISEEQLHLVVDGAGETVQIAWDDPLLETVFYIRSANSGIDWDAAVVVDQREVDDSLEIPGPADINLVVDGTNSHLLWRAGNAGAGCVLYHQWSEDGGSSWHDPEILPTQTSEECPTNIWLLKGQNDGLWLLVEHEGLAYLQVWDGSDWSEQVLQGPLSSFINPLTFRNMVFGCWKPMIGRNNRLMVVGCGTGTINDIWVRERPLGDVQSWFVAPEVDWSIPTPILTTNASLKLPVIVNDLAGLVHGFWLGDVAGSDTAEKALYYSYWDQTAWSRIATLFPLGDIRKLVASYNSAKDRLVLVWHDDKKELFFSQVAKDRAMFPADWSVPETLLFSQPGMGEFDVFINDANKIYIAYAISVNENRGVYLTTSDDDGDTWSEPVKVFDATDAGWEKVDWPRLTVWDDQLYLVWSRFSIVDAEANTLYYAYSNDGGRQWAEPEQVIEAQMTWNDIVAFDYQRAIRIWQEVKEGTTSIRYQVSLDDGQTWNSSTLVPGFEAKMGQPDTVIDYAGQIYLIQLQQGEEQKIQRWQWDEAGLIISEEFVLPESDLSIIDFDTAVDTNGNLDVVYSGQMMQEGKVISLLQFTNRSLDLPELIVTPMPTLVPTNTPQVEVSTVEPEQEATPLPDFSQTSDTGASTSFGEISTPVGIAIGVIPAGLIVVFVFAYRWFKNKR